MLGGFAWLRASGCASNLLADVCLICVNLRNLWTEFRSPFISAVRSDVLDIAEEN